MSRQQRRQQEREEQRQQRHHQPAPPAPAPPCNCPVCRNQDRNRCSGCGNSVTELRKCAACRCVQYCSAECQSE